ncbi:MAG: MBL fold metallo-hydrolase [Pyrinomonadaceae bacterium]
MKIIPLSIPTPFYVGDVNVFLIREEPLTLIDVGPKTKEAAEALRDKITTKTAFSFSDIRRIVLTHAHEDHCGLAQTSARRGEKRGNLSCTDGKPDICSAD